MKKSFKIVGIVCVVIIAMVCVFALPVFKVKNIKINGNSVISAEEIKSALNYENKSIFTPSTQNARAKLSENVYIKDVAVKRKLPDNIEINIIERIPSGYVKYSEDTYLYIDSEGVILEVVSGFKDKLPIVTGLDFKNFNQGQILKIENKEAFNAVLVLSRLMSKYNLTEDTTIVNLSDLDDIHLLVNNVDILFGDISDADTKIQTIKEVIIKLPNYKEIKATVNLKSNTVSIDT